MDSQGLNEVSWMILSKKERLIMKKKDKGKGRREGTGIKIK